MIKKIFGIIILLISIPFLLVGIIQVIIPGDFGIDLSITIILGLVPTFFGIKLFRSKSKKSNSKENDVITPTSNHMDKNSNEDSIILRASDEPNTPISATVDFYVLDVETANENNNSICQIGIAGFNRNGLVNEWVTYINPECQFSIQNISIHGINNKTVKKSPIFPEIYSKLQDLENKIVIQHTGFDKSSINNACSKYKLDNLKYKWLDSSLIAKRTWKEVSKRGYGLGDLARKFNIKFKHHDALEDAIVTGKIVLLALEKSKTGINEWFTLVKKPSSYFYENNNTSRTIKNPKGNKDPKIILKSKSKLTAEEIDSLSTAEAWKKVYETSNEKKSVKPIQVCFTGFNIVEKEELIDLAYSHNIHVVGSITKNLNFLICGSNAGPTKIENATGQGVRMLNEVQFKKMLLTGEIPY